MVDWFQAFTLTVTELLKQGDPAVYGFLFVVALIIEFGIPVPFVQDSTLLLVGYEPSGRLLAIAPLVMASLTAGRLLGASTIYWASYRFGPKFRSWLSRKFPGIESKAQELGAKLGKRSPLAVTVARFTPGLLVPSSVAAGLFRVKYLYFCAGILIASVIADGAEILYGFMVRTGFAIAGVTPSPQLFIASLVILMGLGLFSGWISGKKASKQTQRK